MKRPVFTFLAFSLAFLLWGESSLTLARNYLQACEHGVIDWSNYFAEAEGVGGPVTNAENSAQARALAKYEAIRNARECLMKVIRRIRVDSATIAKDLLDSRPSLAGEVEVLVRRARVVDLVYKENGTAVALVSFNMKYFFAEMMLPETIQTINPVRQPVDPNHRRKKQEAFTGIVVDCRGFQVKPAMVPKIYDENGNEIYGSASVSREHAVQGGMAAFVKGLEAGVSNSRVAGNPLVVKGIRTKKQGVSEIIISNSDAAKIRGTPGNIDLFQKCKVLIVLD